jgi:hypothetical protein
MRGNSYMLDLLAEKNTLGGLSPKRHLAMRSLERQFLVIQRMPPADVKAD